MEPTLLSQAKADIRRRVIEYMGGEGDDAGSATCGYITRCDRGEPYAPENLRPPAAVDRFLDRRQDLARSLLDCSSVLVHLDVEYVDFDDPLTAFRDARRAFEWQQPVVEAILGVLGGFGIHPLHLLTGQGHHLVWRVSREGRAAGLFRRLAPESAHGGEDATEADGDDGAFFGVGMVAEYAAHLALAIARPRMVIPVGLTAVTTGPGRTGRREAVSIDLSEYGDPLRTRTVRVPFTPYRKPLRWGFQAAEKFDTLPLNGLSVEELLAARGNPATTREIGHSGDARIPLVESGTQRLIEAYLRSQLRRFHRFFYSTTPDPPEIWERTYRRTPTGSLPYCARSVAESPNEALLKPAGMQHLLRCLMAQGWHPRHVGGLIWSIFADPRHGWGDRWRHYDPARRADFYARLFSGQMALGLDGLIDFNCVSSKEKGLFPCCEGCPGLESWRSVLAAQVSAGRYGPAPGFPASCDLPLS